MHKVYCRLKGIKDYVFTTRSYSDLRTYIIYMPVGHGESGNQEGDGELCSIESCSIYNSGSYWEVPVPILEIDYA